MGKECDFLDACRDGNLQKVQQLFFGKNRKLPFSLSKNGVLFTNFKDPQTGSTGLHCASLNGHLDIVGFLLSNKSDIRISDVQGCLPLHLASWNGHLDIVDKLLSEDLHRETVNISTNTGDTGLHFVSQYGHTDVARVLIQHGADPAIRNLNGESPLDLAAKNGRKDIVDLLLKSHPQLILSSYSYGAGVHDKAPAFSPLHLAAKYGKTEIVRILLDSGFDINLLAEEGTALHSASLYGKLDVVKLLLERGINIDAKDFYGRTVLKLLEEHRTCKSGNLSQSLKHLDVWQNCVNLIEKVRENRSVSSPMVASVYQNGAADDSQTPSIWMPLPSECAERLVEDQKARVNKLKSSLLTVRTDLSSPIEDSSVCSTISLTPDCSPLTIGGESKTNENWTKMKNKATRNVPAYSCNYQPPPQTGYDNVAAIVAGYPASSYDNIPSNAVGYDNAPPTNHKVWSHECGGIGVETCANSEGDDAQVLRVMGYEPENQSCKQISPGTNDSQQQKSPKPRVTWVGNYDNVPETLSQTRHEPNVGSPDVKITSPDLKIIDKTIELIERSSTDMEQCCRLSIRSNQSSPSTVAQSPKTLSIKKFRYRNDSSTSSSLKAPLAQFENEDLGTSTEGDVFLAPCSPTSPSQIGPVKTPSEPPPSIFDSQAKIAKKIRPMSEELIRVSPELKMISKKKSPKRTVVDGETQVDSQAGSSEFCSSTDCSCSEGSRCSFVCGSSDVLQYVDENISTTGKLSPVAEKPSKKHLDVVSPIDEQAEWRKIEEIFQSYGSAISRLSMFDTQIEPAFTNYLKNSSSRGGSTAESPNGNTSPKRRAIDRWLTSIGLQRYSRNFYEHGFDRLEFLKWTVDFNVLRMIGVDNNVDCQQILRSLPNLPCASTSSSCASNFRYVSDWLHALGCQDSLGFFARRGMDAMHSIVGLTEDDLLNVVGVTLYGHRRRLFWSITSSEFLTDTMTKSVNNNVFMDTDGRSPTSAPAKKIWLHSSQSLVGEGVSYVAHYLGSTEIRDEQKYEENYEAEELRRTESTRRAICELKEKMRDNAKIPEVSLQIRYTGVRLYDAQKPDKLLCEHFVQNIHCVCQDERDMNCFAYNTKDGQRHFCHVFSVFTSDLAREIILSLGQAFEVAYQKALESGRL